VDNICKYYFELLLVLGNRPNITPAFTNELDEDTSRTNINSNDSFDLVEDDTKSLFDEEGIKINGTKNDAVIDVTDKHESDGTNDHNVSKNANDTHKNKYIDIIDDDKDDYVDKFAGIKRTSIQLNKKTRQ
jgi:hypothetical protein